LRIIISVKLKGMEAPDCNSSFLGGRDQEDCGLKLAQEKVSETTSQQPSRHDGTCLRYTRIGRRVVICVLGEKTQDPI
jgi:hypothetical protein